MIVLLPRARTTAGLLLAISLLVLSASAVPGPDAGQNRSSDDLGIAQLQRRFQSPPDDSRIMMRWWWFGPAVTKSELEREMRAMKEAGIGGFEVQPVYPLMPDNDKTGVRNMRFLSDDFIDALRFTSQKARELGLRFDLTLGSGWPFGGPQVSIDHAAGRLRVERVPVAEGARRVQLPSIGPGEKLLAVYLGRAEGKSITKESLRDINEIRDGAAILPEGAAAQSQLQVFITSRTGMQVKRPAVGAEGFVVDHLDRNALEGYLRQVGDRLMQAFDGGQPYAVFCDSLEVYNSDWTADFLEEFQKRRGYDLKPYLAALVNDFGPGSAAVRHDWGRTLTELLNDNFLQPLHEWSRRNKTLLRAQCYGVPAAALSSNAYVDLSEGEGHNWKSLSATRWASSANHLYGRPVTSSETWTWLHSPAFRATPLDLKAEADLHFLQGVNQLIGHGWPYSAPEAEYPGWRFYAAGAFSDKNPWWIVMPDVSKYLQRVSFVLRQGNPVADVAVYLPNDDAWSQFSNGSVSLIEQLRERLGRDLIPRLLEQGYTFDFIDDDSLKQAGRIEGGALAIGPNRYRAIILPNVEQIPLATLNALAEFARGGGVLVATRRKPVRAPGFQASQADHRAVVETSSRLFEVPGARGFFVADEMKLGTVLSSALRPDVVFSPSASDVGFCHRTTPDAEIYFVANTSNEQRRTTATFRIEGMNPEWWDTMSGRVRPASCERAASGGVSVRLNLEPYGARVLVFTRREMPSVASSPQGNPPATQDLSNGWQVTFGAAGPRVSMSALRSWTEDESTRYYSGTADYEKSFALSDEFPQKGWRVRLDFGEGKPSAPLVKPGANGMRAMLDPPIGEAALVFVNDRRAGSVWCPPYSIDITDYLRAGENRLRIVVGNTAINYMAGHALPDYRLLNLRYGERFQPQDMEKLQPTQSGLLGRVLLTAVQTD